jgi:hypothetical protein
MPRDDEATTWGEMVEALLIMGIMTFLLPAAISFLHQFPLPSRKKRWTCPSLEMYLPYPSGATCEGRPHVPLRVPPTIAGTVADFPATPLPSPSGRCLTRETSPWPACGALGEGADDGVSAVYSGPAWRSRAVPRPLFRDATWRFPFQSPRRHPAMPLLKEELFQLLQELHLPDAHIIGAMTVDYLIPDVTLTYAQINRYGIKQCP